MDKLFRNRETEAQLGGVRASKYYPSYYMSHFRFTDILYNPWHMCPPQDPNIPKLVVFNPPLSFLAAYLRHPFYWVQVASTLRVCFDIFLLCSHHLPACLSAPNTKCPGTGVTTGRTKSGLGLAQGPPCKYASKLPFVLQRIQIGF